MVSEVVPGVYSAASRFVDGKNGIVVGARMALAIDCSNYADEGQAMADFIRARGFAPDRLALTHGHGDHIWGGKALAGGEVFAHVLTPGVMETQIAREADRRGVSEDALRVEMPWPTVLFSDELQIDLGGKTAWMFPTPGHSEDGVSLYLVEDRVLFAGDSVVTGIVPAIGNGDSRVLAQSLHRLMGMDIEVLVPGHGEPLVGKARVRDWLVWQAGYLAGVRARVRRELAAGKTPQAATEAVDFESFVGDRLPKDRNGMPKRHRDTVEKIVGEELR